MDNYNVNRKVVNFKDFSVSTEKEELQKVRRSTKPNSEDQQHIGNSRFKFNKVTHKMDDLSPEMIDDKIDAIEELEETNEEFFGGNDNEYKHKIEDINIDVVLEGLDLLRHYNIKDYNKYFGDRMYYKKYGRSRRVTIPPFTPFK